MVAGRVQVLKEWLSGPRTRTLVITVAAPTVFADGAGPARGRAGI